MAEKKERLRISGAWKKESQYGTFYTGKFNMDKLVSEAQEKFPGVTEFQMFVSKLETKEKENDPDLTVTAIPHVPYVKS